MISNKYLNIQRASLFGLSVVGHQRNEFVKNFVASKNQILLVRKKC